MTRMKRCPYCAEEIQDAAIKCKHCGEMLSVTEIAPKTQKQPRAKSVVQAIIVIGVIVGVAWLMLWRISQTNRDAARDNAAAQKRIEQQVRRLSGP